MPDREGLTTRGKLKISQYNTRNISVLRGAVIWSFIVSLLMVAAGSFLIAAYYFDLLYIISENRIIEYADPLIGPVTMPFIVAMSLGALLSAICSIILLILMFNEKKWLHTKKNLALVLGIGNLINFLLGTFLGIYILSYLFSRADQKDGDREKIGIHANQNIISNLLLVNSMYRLVVGLTLFAVYHAVFVIPYEHLGVENAPIIRIVWILLLAGNCYWLILGIIAILLSVLMKASAVNQQKAYIKLRKTLFWMFAVMNIPCIPAGSLLATQLIRLRKCVYDER